MLKDLKVSLKTNEAPTRTISVTPEQLTFTDVQPQQTYTQALTLHNTLGSSVELVSAT